MRRKKRKRKREAPFVHLYELPEPIYKLMLDLIPGWVWRSCVLALGCSV